MGLFTSIEQFGSEITEPVNLALGMFDGVHLGHQKVLLASQKQAQKVSGLSASLTFPLHPASFLRPDHAPSLLMTAEQKVGMLHAFGMDHVILRSFDDELAEVQAEDFISFIKERISTVEGFTVGRNFRFGKDRNGDASFLRQCGDKMGVGVQIVDSKTLEGFPVSSSRIRKDLSVGEIEKVNQMLGRCYRIFGVVCSGKKMGRTIGFPTMNVSWNPEAAPAYGVYAGRVKHLTDSVQLPAVANYGMRPTLENDVQIPILEIHILKDFDDAGWGYGSEVEMSLEKFIRPEKKFESLEILKNQIEKDCDEAIEYLFSS